MHSVSGAQSGGDVGGLDALPVHGGHLRGGAHAQVPRAEGGAARAGQRGAEAAAGGGRGPLEEAGEGRGGRAGGQEQCEEGGGEEAAASDDQHWGQTERGH